MRRTQERLQSSLDQAHSCMLNKPAALGQDCPQGGRGLCASETSEPRLQSLVLTPSGSVSIVVRKWVAQRVHLPAWRTLAPQQRARSRSLFPLCKHHSSGSSGGNVSLDPTGFESRPMAILPPGILRPSSEAEGVLSRSTVGGNRGYSAWH